LIKDYYPQVQTQTSVKYSIIIILQRLLIILGKDGKNLIEYFLTNEIKYPGEDIFEDVLKLLHNTCQLLKVEAKPIIAKNFHYYFELIKQVNIPKSNVSDVDKILINFFFGFTKLVHHICLEFIESFFNGDILNVNPEELLTFLITVSIDICDTNTKRQTVKNLKLMISCLIRLLSNNNTLITVIEKILTSTFQIFARLNMSDPVEQSTLADIVCIHYAVFKSGQEYFVNYLNNINTSLGINPEMLKTFYEGLVVFDPVKPKNLDVFAKYYNEVVVKNSYTQNNGV